MPWLRDHQNVSGYFIRRSSGGKKGKHPVILPFAISGGMVAGPSNILSYNGTYDVGTFFKRADMVRGSSFGAFWDLQKYCRMLRRESVKYIRNVCLLILFVASPLLMIGGVLLALYRYPEIPFYAWIMMGIGFSLKIANKPLERAFNRNMESMEYDEYGRRKGMEDYSSMSRKERLQVDKQKLAEMERIVSSSALKRMQHPGEKDPDGTMNELVGMEPVKKQMKMMAARMEYDRENQKKKKKKAGSDTVSSRHMMFFGSPGTGKTTVARIMTGFLYKNKFIKENKCLETDGNFLKASTTADTAAKTEIVVRQAFGGVLFIDEAYALLSGDAAGEAAIATLIKQMEDNRDKFVLILAGYTDEMNRLVNSNPGFASRFKDYVRFPDYTVDEMCDIFSCMVNQKGLCVDGEAMEHFRVRIAKEKKGKHFGNARTVRNVMEECIDHHAVHIKDGKLNGADRYKLVGMDVSENVSEYFGK